VSGNGRNSVASARIYGVEEVPTNNKKKVKKMGWLKRKLAQWCREAWEDGRNTTALVREADTPSPKSSVRFAIYPAAGGWIIEHGKNDRYKDNDGPNLTIITDFDDLGKTVEHIITLESLRS
jgi:hypothetical protein